ncbi:OmpA family protein [Nocardiopsis sp. LOL_012]|uniref:OmpA family protein n=1 Tax=Nocardiopsis sp. LOL_012 TaxID=3345409 RepID=UPI003A844974
MPVNLPSHRPRPKKRKLLLGSCAILFSLLTSSCVVSPSEETQTTGNLEEDSSSASSSPPGSLPAEEEVIASSLTSSTELGSSFQIDIVALERLQNDVIRLRFNIENKSPQSFLLNDGLAETEKGDMYTTGALTLIDTINQKRYISYDANDGSCVCHTLEGSIREGGNKSAWVVFPAPPSNIDQMTVVTPLTPPMFDVPISESTEILEDVNLADPVILDLTMISDDLEENTGRTEDEDEISIILSSDVLFATNSSDLNLESQDILEQVAVEISDANSTVVKVDGYTDNTGTDSINNPLSLKRAETVEATLSELITRDGVSFEVNGHGSKDPIADNSTPEGQERNRRVTITFEK